MDKPIISLWGFGPSYRKRVKLNILEAINSGYENTMDYVVLTDYPDDFKELAEETGKIKAIIDIKEARKDYLWSIQNEFIPSAATNAKKYGEQYLENLHNGNMFSYSLHRFSFPTIAELGYNKIVFMDGDVKIRYDKIGNELTEEEFWEEFNTPSNTMKGCVAETIKVDIHNGVFQRSQALGYNASGVTLQLSSILLDRLNQKYDINNYPLVDTLDITEGPFRYYHLESPDKVKQLFDIWNDCMEIILSSNHYTNCQQCGGYMLCDYIPVATANIFCNISVMNFPNTIYNRHIHFEDRYFLPPGSGAPGLGILFKAADDQDDFIEKNKELKQILDERKAWPHTEPY